MRERLEVRAVGKSGLIEILQERGLLDRFENGELICPSTGQVLSWENLGMVRIENGEIVLYSIDADLNDGYGESGL